MPSVSDRYWPTLPNRSCKRAVSSSGMAVNVKTLGGAWASTDDALQSTARLRAKNINRFNINRFLYVYVYPSLRVKTLVVYRDILNRSNWKNQCEMQLA